MENIFISCLYGISLGLALSVDAFMIGLVYGITCNNKIENIITSTLVGIFHFIMPILGYYIAFKVFTKINLANYLKDKIQIISFIILMFLGLMMINKKDNNYWSNKRNIIKTFLFAFSVSIDSFLAGIAFTTINHIHIITTSMFISIISLIITLISLSLGLKTKEKFINKNLEFYAGILVIILAIITLFT